jgi:hypothetical protein
LFTAYAVFLWTRFLGGVKKEDGCSLTASADLSIFFSLSPMRINPALRCVHTWGQGTVSSSPGFCSTQPGLALFTPESIFT